MFRPLSSQSIVNFLQKADFKAEPVYVKTPDGYVLELNRMAFITLEDDEGEDSHVYPILLGEYTDIEVDIDSSFGDINSYLPPS